MLKHMLARRGSWHQITARGVNYQSWASTINLMGMLATICASDSGWHIHLKRRRLKKMHENMKIMQGNRGILHITNMVRHMICYQPSVGRGNGYLGGSILRG